MAAAAGTTGAAAFQVFLGGNAPEFKRFADQLVDLFLNVLHRFLGFDKTFAHGIAEERLAIGIEDRYFSLIKGQALLLFLMEETAFFGQVLVLLFRFGIGHECFHLLANILKFRLLDDGLAQFACFLADDALSLNKCFHNINDFPIRRWR
jgi:hypothetical protein